MRQGGRRQSQDLQVLHARQVLQCQLPAESLAEKYKKDCKRRACAELHDEALFKDPPAKEDCPICFLLMPARLICCATSFQDATITSVPIFDFAKANEGLAKKAMEEYYLLRVYTPSKILEMMISVRFAIPTELAKQIQRKLKN